MTDEEIQEGSDRVTGILNRANWGIWRFAGQTLFGRGRMRLSDGGTEATDGHIAVRVNAPLDQKECFGSEHDIARDQRFDICADLEGAKQIEKEIPLNPSISRFGNTGVQVLEKCVKVGGFTRNGDPRVQSVERLSGSHHNLFLLWGGRLKAIANGEETPGEFRVILDARIMRDFCDYVLRYSGKKSASPIHFQFNGPDTVVIALAELEQSQITAAIMPMREGSRGWRDLAKTSIPELAAIEGPGEGPGAGEGPEGHGEGENLPAASPAPGEGDFQDRWRSIRRSSSERRATGDFREGHEHNPECDGSHCVNKTGQARRFDLGNGTVTNLCMDCFLHENEERAERRARGETSIHSLDWENSCANEDLDCDDIPF